MAKAKKKTKKKAKKKAAKKKAAKKKPAKKIAAKKKTAKKKPAKKKAAKKKPAKKQETKKKGKLKKNISKTKRTESDKLSKVIDSLLHRIWGVQYCAETFIVPDLTKNLEEYNSIIDEFKNYEKDLESKDQSIQIIACKKILDADFRRERLLGARIEKIIVIGYFLNLFCSFDAFTGDLFRSIYRKKPEFLKNLEQSMTIREMLKFENLEDIKSIIIENEIESFRRESYIKQFKKLESRFSIETLRKFESWPSFIECSQRRNLLAHCDGVVNNQYLRNCEEAGYTFAKPPKLGQKLGLKPDYFFSSLELLMEVGVKLGQTLWRILFPNELEEADEHLIKTIFDFLKMGQWNIAKSLGVFAISQPRSFNDETKRVLIINYAIALKFGGQFEKTKEILGTLDWSVVSNEFKLANAVLLEQYSQAKGYMEMIGKRSNRISEQSYHIWPLFRDFRGSDEFLKGYEKVYGYPFSVELQRTVKATETRAEKDLEKKKKVFKKIISEKNNN